ncbi:hypothetical protein B0T42_05225 [Rathayibacter sp. VKM Ac-2630]|nr:hypothetical protein B0T42_05225 [Rathayibacter sp. VKM Ac-2630]
MSAHVTTALRVVRLLGERPDPTAPLGVGAVAAALGAPLSSVSRLCSELEGTGLIARGEAYGSYRLGASAVRLSGRAAAPVARSLRFALTLAAQQTGETVVLAAGAPGQLRVIGSVLSSWTLHSPATVGERIVSGAIARARRPRTRRSSRPRACGSRSRRRCSPPRATSSRCWPSVCPRTGCARTDRGSAGRSPRRAGASRPPSTRCRSGRPPRRSPALLCPRRSSSCSTSPTDRTPWPGPPPGRGCVATAPPGSSTRARRRASSCAAPTGSSGSPGSCTAGSGRARLR